MNGWTEQFQMIYVMTLFLRKKMWLLPNQLWVNATLICINLRCCMALSSHFPPMSPEQWVPGPHISLMIRDLLKLHFSGKAGNPLLSLKSKKMPFPQEIGAKSSDGGGKKKKKNLLEMSCNKQGVKKAWETFPRGPCAAEEVQGLSARLNDWANQHTD